MNPSSDRDETPGRVPDDHRIQRIQRRTIVKGAAWTIPVVAAAVAIPVAAASTSDTLTFNGSACINEKMRLTFQLKDNHGRPSPGKAISFSFPDGIKVGGQSTYTGTTDATGSISFDIDPAPSGTYTVTTSNASPGSFSVSVTRGTLVGKTRVYSDTNSTPTIDGGSVPLPQGAVAVAGGYWLSVARELLYLSAPGVLISVDSNVDAAVGSIGNNGANHVTYTSGGNAKAALNGNVIGSYPSVPRNAEPLGGAYFLSAGNLYFGDTLLASGVTSAYGTIDDSGTNTVTYMSSGVAHGRINGAAPVTWSSVPSGSKALGCWYFLAPNGDLYWMNSKVDTNVTAGVGQGGGSSQYMEHLGYMSGGVAKSTLNPGGGGNGMVTFDQVPGDATPLGGHFFLSGTNLYYGNTRIDVDVQSAKATIGDNNFNHVTYTKAVC